MAPVPGAAVTLSSGRGTTTDSLGRFTLTATREFDKSVAVSHLSFYSKSKFIRRGHPDTLFLEFNLEPRSYLLDSFSFSAVQLPDTVVGSPEYSLEDFTFIADTLVLLTYPKVPGKDQQIIFADQEGNPLRQIPVDTKINSLYKDFLGRVFALGDKKVFEISAGERSVTMFNMNLEEFNRSIKPCSDTLPSQIIFSDYSSHFPAFSYYTYDYVFDSVKPLRFVEDPALHRQYRYEYYHLRPSDKHFARRLSRETGVDVHTVAAMMTGFTSSWFFEPLYAPLYRNNDTVYVFDHHASQLVKYDLGLNASDSVPITYHHTRKASAWRKAIIRDELTGEFYGLFRDDNFYDLKRIDPISGTIDGRFRLYYRYVENIHIRNGYAYYIWHPFESVQKKFLYRERIEF